MSENLKNLLEKRETAKKYYESLGIRNCYGLTPEEQIELDVSYEQARIAYIKAELAYRDAVSVMASQNADAIVS